MWEKNKIWSRKIAGADVAGFNITICNKTHKAPCEICILQFYENDGCIFYAYLLFLRVVHG